MKQGKRFIMLTKAIILMASFVFVSCEKSTGSLGLDLVIDDKTVIGTKRNMAIKTYTYDFDSINSTNPINMMAGTINDMVFGKVEYESVMQLSLENVSPDFGATAVLDSSTLIMPYSGSYGDTLVPMTITIEELSVDIRDDSTYYSNHTFGVLGKMGEHVVAPRPKTKITLEGEEYDASMLIPIDTAWTGPKIFRGSRTDSSSFVSNDAFLEYFKGIKIRANGTGNSSVYFNFTEPFLPAYLRLYYREHKDSTEVQSFDLRTLGTSNSVNVANYDFSGAEFDVNNPDTINGEIDTYIQSMGGVATRLDFGVLETYKDSGFMVNKAELIVRVRPGSANGMPPPDQLLLLEDKG
ncbi:MAG: DUF4270 domain-containing protein, partial [Schleiferiaceae bacterium]|nr:DUF4270 domain-containing protein [Schleiferiaceae bacterium]